MSVRYFSDAEYDRRRKRVRDGMSQRGLDACLIASPENIYYLTGLDHMGYFAYQVLILPLKSQPFLITRSMERATVRDQVPDVIHIGYAEGNEPPLPAENKTTRELDKTGLIAESTPLTRELRRRPPRLSSSSVNATVVALRDAGLANRVLGIDLHSTFFPYNIAEGVMSELPDADWQDLGTLVDDCRIIQSPGELELTRQAAEISVSMMLSAIAAAGNGVNNKEIMAAIYDAMFRRGGTYPGFVPLVRSGPNLEHEHGTWEDRYLEHGDILFLEMAGCVRRYHAPLGRLVFIGESSQGAGHINAICQEAMATAIATIKPDVLAGDVYENWQQVLDSKGLSHYTRHHCGYSVGIGYPPSWSGSGVPVGLRRNSEMRLREGMVFHLMSWLLRSGIGDAFLSDTIVITKEGAEVLTEVDRGLQIR